MKAEKYIKVEYKYVGLEFWDNACVIYVCARIFMISYPSKLLRQLLYYISTICKFCYFYSFSLLWGLILEWKVGNRVCKHKWKLHGDLDIKEKICYSCQEIPILWEKNGRRSLIVYNVLCMYFSNKMHFLLISFSIWKQINI